MPVVLVDDYNVKPTELDVYKPERWTDDALFRTEVRDAFRNLADQGWTMRYSRCILVSASTRPGIFSGINMDARGA